MAENTSDNFIRAPPVVGFEDEALKIMERLDGKPKHLDIISIVGMPGLGKTTLALKVYNHPYVAHNFYARAWISISQVYNKRDLLLGILTSPNIGHTTESDLNLMSDENLKEQLYKCLKGKRYLIVLDDIWDIKAWDELKRSFPNDNNVSRIIFTSRIKDVALRANSIPHDKRLLSSDESWDLLQEKVFGKEICPPELMKVGKTIAEKCGGLPLAIVTIGGLLAKTEKTEQWWMDVCKSIMSYLGSDSNQVTKTLELSYNHLPVHLKPLFLYFGAFLEDDEVYVPKLIWLWIAEGFIEKSGAEIVEDVAKGYLMDLIERSLIMISGRSFNGGVKSCRIHDLLRDLCLRKAEEESFMQIINRYDDRLSSSSSSSSSLIGNKFNRVSISFGSLDDLPSEHYATICSLLVFRSIWIHFKSNFQPFKLLKVLDLYLDYRFFFFPSEFGQLVHLRYFALKSKRNSLKEYSDIWGIEPLVFPPSIYKLKNLETLIWDYDPTSVNYDFFQLTKLRHLHIRNFFHNDQLEEKSMVHLIKNYYNKVLPDLQTMSEPIFTTFNSCTIFCNAPNLRELSCTCTEVCIRPMLRELMFLVKLEKLKMSCFEGMSKYTYWLFDLPASLKRITLSLFIIDLKDISKLASLPNLEVLKLIKITFVGKLWDTSLLEESSFQPFPKLKFLKFEDPDIEQWTTSMDHFPSLERLVVSQCFELKEIPADLGDIPTLKTIEVNWPSYSLVCCVSEILEEQQGKGNEQLEIFIYPPDFYS